MPPFRGSDDQLDREVETLDGIVRLRVRRYAKEMRELDKDLKELRAEQRARRRAQATAEAPVDATASTAAES